MLSSPRRPYECLLHGWSVASALLAIVAVTIAGCWQSSSTSGTAGAQSAVSLQRQADRSEALLSAAVGQLRDLPSFVSTELRPPVVILDSTKSREARQGGEGQDVLATLTQPPNTPEGQINYLSVPAGNSLFRLNGVKPGDVVKYYVLVNQESLEEGFTEVEAMELKVAQVLNDNALLLEGGASQQITEPAKIEVWRYVDDRLEEIASQLGRYVYRRLPPIGWEPGPDQEVLGQITDWLNQWIRQSRPKTDWQLDALAGTLSTEFADDEALAAYVSADALGQEYFQPYDGRRLQEAVWLRDIARWAHGDSFDDVARASALLDWTVRNVQLDPEAPPRLPWQTLLYGRGTADQRAWVFALLCRQQGLDVVVLDVANQEGEQRFWLPALLTDGQLYLFDTRLGLPIPGPEGKGVATLRDLQADDGLLRRLDVESATYPVSSGQLQHVTANVVADWFDLSRRARLLEERLSGDDRLALTAGAQQLADRLTALPGIAEVRVWDVPYRTLQQQLNFNRGNRQQAALDFEPFAQRPMLWKARVLHFRGQKRPADQATKEIIDDHRLAAQAYTSPSVRPPVRVLDGLSSAPQRKIYETAKTAAAYWVGLLLYDDGKYGAAEDWLGRRELQAGGGKWSDGARYNLARTYEEEGKLDEAISLLRKDQSPQRAGSLLRARTLEARAATGEESAAP
jgi:hypothetical protein